MKMIKWILAVLMLLAVVLVTACNTPQQTKAYNSIYTVQKTTVAAFDAYLGEVVAGRVPTNDVPTIAHHFNTFQASALVALDAVQFNTNALAPANLVVESQDLLNLINTVTTKR